MMSDSDSDRSNSDACSDNLGEKSVTFTTVEIHEHAVIMGDNPSTTHGPPLEVDWVEQAHYSLDLDEYEEMRPQRRHKKELAIPSSVRESL
jgi:hypothetical protein